MGLFECPGNEGEEFHQMFAICDETIKTLPPHEMFFFNFDEINKIKTHASLKKNFLVLSKGQHHVLG